MSANIQHDKSLLFLVRIRAENAKGALGPEGEPCHGRVQHVVTGEAYDFRGWAELIKLLALMLDDPSASGDVDT